jgi:hypothetical protein
MIINQKGVIKRGAKTLPFRPTEPVKSVVRLIVTFNDEREKVHRITSSSGAYPDNGRSTGAGATLCEYLQVTLRCCGALTLGGKKRTTRPPQWRLSPARGATE